MGMDVILCLGMLFFSPCMVFHNMCILFVIPVFLYITMSTKLRQYRQIFLDQNLLSLFLQLVFRWNQWMVITGTPHMEAQRCVAYI